MAQDNTDFEALARQYWNAWGDALRQGSTPAPQAAPTAPGWQDAIDWWSRLARGGGSHDADAAVERFNAQARHWYGQMQQVAARFSGQPADASAIVAEWKRALDALGGNPFAEMFKAMRGPGAQDWQQWQESVAPYLEAWRREGKSWLGMPAFGSGREQQQRWQQLAQAQLDSQQAESAYHGLLAQALQRAYAGFQDKLAARMEPGRQLTSARALFDLWIDAAEEAYADMALSPQFRTAYGAMVNAQMRLRGGVQREVEQACALLGMPTRSEVDAAHRKIAELERMLRRMRDAGASTGTGATASARAHRAAATPAKTRRQPAAKPATESLKVAGDPVTGPRRNAAVNTGKTASAKAGPSKPGPSKPASKRAASRSAAAKPATKPAAAKAATKPAKRTR